MHAQSRFKLFKYQISWLFSFRCQHCDFYLTSVSYCWYAVFFAETNSFQLSNLDNRLYFRRQSILPCIPFIHMRRLAIKTMTFRIATICNIDASHITCPDWFRELSVVAPICWRGNWHKVQFHVYLVGFTIHHPWLMRILSTGNHLHLLSQEMFVLRNCICFRVSPVRASVTRRQSMVDLPVGLDSCCIGSSVRSRCPSDSPWWPATGAMHYSNTKHAYV